MLVVGLIQACSQYWVVGIRYLALHSRYSMENSSRVMHLTVPYAQAVADEHDMELHVASISEQDFVDSIAKVIYHLDSPVGPGAFLSTWSRNWPVSI